MVTWAKGVAKLTPQVIQALEDHHVNGQALLSISEAELESKLGLDSCPARQFVWDWIQVARHGNLVDDFAVAVDLHEKEIEGLASLDAHHVDPVVISVLKTSTQPVLKQIVEDNAFAWSLVGDTMDQQLYEDREYAREQQAVYDQQLAQLESDRQLALSLSGKADPAKRITPQRSQVSTPVATTFEVIVGVDKGVTLSEGREKRGEKRSNPPDVRKDKMAVTVTESKGEVTPFMTSYEITNCDACFQKNMEGFVFACGHASCRSCLRTLFLTALGDSSLLPLQCCELPLDMNVVDDLLKPQDAETLRNRLNEMSAKDKMFCPSCGAFSNLDLVDKSLSAEMPCHGCGVLLCVICKTRSHSRITCEVNQRIGDDDDKEVLNLAKSKGWKQCPNCNILIELSIGCNHMKCENCKHLFCFKCLRNWQQGSNLCSSGRCDLWDETNLIQAGEARVRAEELARRIQFQPEQRRERQDQHMRALRSNETCRHRWVRRDGLRGTCERCAYDLWCYGMVCQSDCKNTVCYTCAHHRIPLVGWHR